MHASVLRDLKVGQLRSIKQYTATLNLTLFRGKYERPTALHGCCCCEYVDIITETKDSVCIYLYDKIRNIHVHSECTLWPHVIQEHTSTNKIGSVWSDTKHNHTTPVSLLRFHITYYTMSEYCCSTICDIVWIYAVRSRYVPATSKVKPHSFMSAEKVSSTTYEKAIKTAGLWL